MSPMNPACLRYAVLVFCATSLLGACSPQGGAPAPSAEQQQAQARAADAARNLDTYRQLLRINNDEMAVSMGKAIVKRFPDSDAAREVTKTFAAKARLTELSVGDRVVSTDKR